MSVISEPISIGDFFKEISEKHNEIRSYKPVLNKEKYDLKKRLTRYKDDPRWLVDTKKENETLATVRKRKEYLESCDAKKSFDSNKYSRSDAPWKHAMVKKQETLWKKDNSKKEFDKLFKEITQPELIITINYHKPIINRQKLFLKREIQVLSSTLLTDLRDFLPCLSDDMLADPVESLEEKVHETEKEATRDRYKSGYFFIENIFYNDFRSPYNIDYSQVVMDWAHKRKKERGEYKSTTMSGVKIRDLTIRQHKPYLYCHQGDCCHIITFTDIQLLNPTLHTTNSLSYPLESYKRLEKNPLCSVCHLSNVRWVVVNSSLCPESPSFFCYDCMLMFHCSSDGKLLDPSIGVHFYPRVD